MNAFRAALVIARRDYVASVWSRTFLLFLIGPLLPLVAAALFGSVGTKLDRAATRPVLAVIAAPDDAAAIGHARARLAGRLGEDTLPAFRYVLPDGAAAAQAGALLKDAASPANAVLSGGLDAPLLTGPEGAIGTVGRDVALILDRARATRAMGTQRVEEPAQVAVDTQVVGQAAGNDVQGRLLIARFGQVVLMFLTVLLTGMMVSNMVEEKSNKVIEVLTAAVPVDGIFFGKLIAMLGLSLTGIAVWGGGATAAALLFANGGAGLTPPAVGWPMFGVLALIYFAAIYLLIGAVFLGIGAQAGSVREVQTMSMPLTMAQLGVVAFASTAITDLHGGLGLAAAAFPWSSPYAMLARAAQEDALWPHAVAILWQGLWVALTIRVVSRWFRVSVLKSGRPGPLARWLARRRTANEAR